MINLLLIIATVTAYVCFFIDTILLIKLSKINEERNSFIISNNNVYNCFSKESRKRNKIKFIIIGIVTILYFILTLFYVGDFLVIMLIFNSFTLNIEEHVLNGLLGDEEILSKKGKKITYSQIEKLLVSKEREYYNVKYTLKDSTFSEKLTCLLNEDEYNNLKKFISDKKIDLVETF